MALSTKPPSGTRDFLAPELRRRRRVMDTIQTIYERHGFEPLETPTFERIDTLTGKYGEEGDQLLFRILKRGDKLQQQLDGEGTSADDLVDFGLRYDLTVPLARVVAQHRGQLPAVWKRYQMQPVWRADRPQKGRFREFWQCDVDCVGSSSVAAEAEVISAVTEALRALSFTDFRVRLNDRRILTGLMEVAGVSEDRQGPALVAIDKLDKIGPDGVQDELRAGGLSSEAIASLARTVLQPASRDNAEDLRRLGAAFEGRSATGSAGIERLLSLLDVFATAPAAGAIAFDPALARGLSYYTGPIFEIAVEGLAGSMGGGGRYDGLVGMFSGKPVPAVGFSLGFERLVVVLEERGWFGDDTAATDVLVALLDESDLPACARLVRDLRRAGLHADLQTDASRLGKQLKAAEERNIPFVAILGSREIADGTVALKDLATGEQVTIGQRECAATLRAMRETQRR